MDTEKEQPCRRECLLDNRNLIVAVNLLLQELDDDLYRHGLAPCAGCRGRYTGGQASAAHERLVDIYNSLLTIRDNLIEIRRQADPEPNRGRRPTRMG